MQQFYSLMILSDAFKGKEITLPNKCYLIHSRADKNIDLNIITETKKKEKHHAENVNLGIKLSDPSLKSITLTLHDNYYRLVIQTNNDILTTKEICYNHPFFHHGFTCFSIKKIDDHWHKNIIKLSEKNVINKGWDFFHYRKKQIAAITFILIMLIMLVTYCLHDKKTDKKTDKNHYETDMKMMINQLIMHSGYIQEGNDLLFIIKPDRRIPDDVYHKLKPYRLHTINSKTLKRHDGDIISIKNNNNKINIIHISDISDIKTTASAGKLNIPDAFKDKILITAFSFSEIVQLINKSISSELNNYSIERKNNKIIIYAHKEKNDNIDSIITMINEKIAHNKSDVFIEYQKTKNPHTPPGLYGKENYRFLSDTHMNVTPHIK